MKFVLFFIGLVLIIACQSATNVAPQPDLAKLLIGKWKLTSIYYLSQTDGKYKAEIQVNPDYTVSEFIKSDTLLFYKKSETATKAACQHLYKYQLKESQPKGYFALANQLTYSTVCPDNNGTYSYSSGFSVTQDTLTLEPAPSRFLYKYIRLN